MDVFIYASNDHSFTFQFNMWHNRRRKKKIIPLFITVSPIRGQRVTAAVCPKVWSIKQDDKRVYFAEGCRISCCDYEICLSGYVYILSHVVSYRRVVLLQFWSHDEQREARQHQQGGPGQGDTGHHHQQHRIHRAHVCCQRGTHTHTSLRSAALDTHLRFML